MTYKTLQFWHPGTTVTIRQGYCLRNAELLSQRGLKLQHSSDITAEVKGISLRSINPRATQRLQPIFIALELLRKADGLCTRNGSSHSSGLQEDLVEWPNMLLFDGIHLAGTDFFFPKVSLNSSLPWLWGSGEALWGAVLLLHCCQWCRIPKPWRNLLGESPYRHWSPAGCTNPLGQLHNSSLIKFQSLITCDKIEARGWMHNECFWEPCSCDSLLCGGLNTNKNECLNQSTNSFGPRVRKTFSHFKHHWPQGTKANIY